MKKLFANSFPIVFISLALVLSTGCSLDVSKPKSKIKILLKEESAVNAPDTLTNTLTDILIDTLLPPKFTTYANPTSISDFNCFAINVTGPGIQTSGTSLGMCTLVNNMRGRGKGYLSSEVPRGSSIEVDLPSGASRTIDVYGTYPSCGGGSGSGSGGGAGGYFLGSTTRDLIENTSVTIPISYTAGTNADISCGSSTTTTNPFGNGADGPYTFSSSTNVSTTNLSANRLIQPSNRLTSVSSSVYTISPAPGTNDYLVGDEIAVIIVGQGNSGDCGSTHGVGEMALARVTAVSGANITVDTPISNVSNTYLNSATAAVTHFCAAEVIRIPNFTNITISSGVSITANSFNYSNVTGGIIMFRANGTLNVTAASSINTNGLGMNFGNGGAPSFTGDGHVGSSIAGAAANGTGGGGGGSGSGGGGGGGNYVTGGAGGSGGAGGIGTSCTTCNTLGGGGGGGYSSGAGNGGRGGGMTMIYVKNMTLSAALTIGADGANGVVGGSGAGGGGGGAGGYVTFVSKDNSASLTLSAMGGNGGNGGSGANGGGSGSGGSVDQKSCTSTGVATQNSGTGAIGTGTVNGSAGNNGGVSNSHSTSNSFCSA